MGMEGLSLTTFHVLNKQVCGNSVNQLEFDVALDELGCMQLDKRTRACDAHTLA